MTYWPVVVIVLQLIFLEGILSIDNAAVIGALVSPLPDNEEVPWPGALKKLGTILHPVLGFQRMAALRVGLLGAYVGRGAMLFVRALGRLVGICRICSHDYYSTREPCRRCMAMR